MYSLHFVPELRYFKNIHFYLGGFIKYMSREPRSSGLLRGD